ncbi:MAG: putative enzyme related to lactoylglutathione lyase [Chlamydiales bacterium]|jgi:predicted enzyme related to lactoylglutathione lyase
MPYPTIDKKLFYVEFPTTDLPATKTFFGAAFDWEWQDWGPEYASGVNAGIDCGLRKESDPPPAGGVLIILWADDLEATLERVVEHGGEVSKPIFSFPGGRRFHFREPSGNELAVCSGA